MNQPLSRIIYITPTCGKVPNLLRELEFCAFCSNSSTGLTHGLRISVIATLGSRSVSQTSNLKVLFSRNECVSPTLVENRIKIENVLTIDELLDADEPRTTNNASSLIERSRALLKMTHALVLQLLAPDVQV
jgi:hypothetical protein